jgi:site-specific recombinase XerD
MARRAPKHPDLAALLPSWELYMRAERKSPATIELYGRGVRAFLTWCQETGTAPVLERPTVAAFVAGLLDDGKEATTARAYQLALRRLAAWLVEEDELPADPLVGMKPPKLDTKVTPVLSDGQLRDLLAACQGKELRDRRDEALVRLLTETALRAGEALALTVDDVDLAAGTVLVRRGKGGKGRIVPFAPQTGRAIDRYLRLRRAHRLAPTPALWVGNRGKGFGYDGLYNALRDRAELAGIKGFHPHVLRHTAASRWLAAGGSEGGLMAVAGWANRAMLDRYAAATRAERAADEARRLGLGDL